MAPKPARTPSDPNRATLVIPESLVTQMLDPSRVFGALGATDDLDAASAYRSDTAIAEIAQALLESERSLSWLHLLREGIEAQAYRRGYRDGAAAAGWIVHGVARDEGGEGSRAR